MSITRHLGLPLPCFATLALGAGTAAYAVLHDTLWLLASAAVLACVSAFLLARRWHVGLAAALLACLGATATVSSAAAVLAAYQQLRSDTSSAAEEYLLTEEERADLAECPDSLLSRTSEACARIDARRDLARGVMRVYIRGLAEDIEWDVRLLAEHGVKRESIGGCHVPPGKAKYAKGYHEIMIPAMREKFGAELFERMSHRAYPVGQPRPPEIRNAVASVDFGYVTVNGGLDKNIVRRHVRRELPRIQYCYQRYIDPRRSGTVVVSFQISPQGTVAKSWAHGVSVEVSSCVAEVIDSIQFPESEGPGPVKASFPLTFGPERGLSGISAAPKDHSTLSAPY